MSAVPSMKFVSSEVSKTWHFGVSITDGFQSQLHVNRGKRKLVHGRIQAARVKAAFSPAQNRGNSATPELRRLGAAWRTDPCPSARPFPRLGGLGVATYPWARLHQTTQTLSAPRQTPVGFICYRAHPLVQLGSWERLKACG